MSESDPKGTAVKIGFDPLKLTLDAVAKIGIPAAFAFILLSQLGAKVDKLTEAVVRLTVTVEQKVK